MDLATLLGLIGAMGVIVASIMVGGDFGQFVNVPSLLVVVGGSIFVVLLRFTVGQFFGSFKVALKAFFIKSVSEKNLITEAVELANIARKEGILALEGRDIQHPFLSLGISMCIDGHQPEVVRALLSKDISLTIERHDIGVNIFKAFGDAAPAMGMIGTLIGLVQMLANMADPKAIGPAMAVALLTTLYGSVIANAIALPIAEKLRFRSNEEKRNRKLILESVTGIQEGTNPRVLEQMLLTFLPQGKRAAVAQPK